MVKTVLKGNERLECVVGCLRCNTVVGKVMAREQSPDNWMNIPIPDPLLKYCPRCHGVIERLP